MIRLTADAERVVTIDWGYRNKARIWLPLKTAITEALVRFGFNEKNIIFVSENRQPRVGEFTVDLYPYEVPCLLLVRKITEIADDHIKLRPFAEISLIGALF